jgi:hypothetical protein
MDICALHIRSIDRMCISREIFLDIRLHHSYTSIGSHRRHDHLGTIGIDCTLGYADISDPVPVSSTDDRPEIARITDRVEDESESISSNFCIMILSSGYPHPHHEESSIIGLESRDTTEFSLSDDLDRESIFLISYSFYCQKSLYNLKIRIHTFANSLGSLHEKESRTIASLAFMESAYSVYL